MISLGRELAAFNTLPATAGQSAPLVWRTSLANNFDAQDAYADEMRAKRRRAGSSALPARRSKAAGSA